MLEIPSDTNTIWSKMVTGKPWQISNFKNLIRKTLVKCNELSFSFLIKTYHSHAMLNLKTIIIYFIIMCSAKMVHAYAVSSVLRGYHKHTDVWSALNDGA